MSDCVPDTLLVGGSFFGYAQHIIDAMSRSGRRVLWFDDRPTTEPVAKALLRLSSTLVAGRINAHVDGIIAAARKASIRDVLIVKGEGLPPHQIERLRTALPDSRFVLYFWDSYRNMPADSPAKVDVCDRTFTFDPDDAAIDTRLSYRPLFFTPDCEEIPRLEPDIDLLWVGTMHSDRQRIIGRLRRRLPASLRFHRHQYVAAPFILAFRKIFDPSYWPARTSDFTFSPMGRAQMLEFVSRSRVVLDIERSIQRGLTMRTIETLGIGRKLVTTNEHVLAADFYDPRNIAVIDRRNPVVPADFWETEYREPPAGVVNRYRISVWLEEVLAPITP